MTTRGASPPYAGRVIDSVHDPEEDRPATTRLRGGDLRAAARAWPAWVPWALALVLFVIAIQTAPSVLDIDAVSGGLLPLVALAAAAPFGLVSREPGIGWVLSVASAWIVSRAFPVLDGDPWPWPVVHGLVLLALVFAVAWRLRPGSRDRTVVALVGVWLVTALVFIASVPSWLQAGWTVGVTAVAVAGLLARWLVPPPPAPTTARTRLPDDWKERLTDGFHTTFLANVTSPPVTRPDAEPRGDRLWRRILPWVAVVAAFWISAATVPEIRPYGEYASALVAVLVAVAVALIPSRVLIGWRVMTAAGALLLAVGAVAGDGNAVDFWPIVFQVTWLATIAVASARHDRGVIAWVWATTVVVGICAAPFDLGATLTLVVGTTALVFVGDLIRTRRQATSALAEQTEVSELERARRAVLEERTRIARDLHDIVAHHMSMVVVQAESAPYRLDGLSDEARTEFASISTSARQALGEIRGLLGVLRHDGTVAAGTAPQPGLDDIAELVGTVERSGVPVTLSIGEDLGDVRDAVGLTAFRIVQESLANAARHAPGADVDVAIARDDAHLYIDVINPVPWAGSREDAGTTPPDTGGVFQSPVTQLADQQGHGIVGMRERAAAVGGTLDAGPAADGRFLVTAVLPLDAEEVP